MPAIQPGPHVIGLLYPGEMGAGLGRLLREEGHRVVTTLDGRGPRTHQNCHQAGLEQLPTLRAVLETATALLSLVPPQAALAVAGQCREVLAQRPAAQGRLLYVDLNSISPATTREIATVFAGLPVDFVDGGISGPASHLCSRVVVYVSGPHATQAAALFPAKVRVKILGEVPGQASALRMLLSGLAKGVVALFVEMALAARQAEVLDTLLEAYQTSYPGVLELVDRSLPTFPRHAVRRGKELEEVEATLSDLGLRPVVVAGARQLIQEMGTLWPDDAPDANRSVPEIVNALHELQLLRRPLDGNGVANAATHPERTTLESW
jgi:3-hydroxyisobutyrate dehydrogenase-like beta-hydroxyacid dehydrogenase